jgi:hypothetical protein
MNIMSAKLAAITNEKEINILSNFDESMAI